MAQEPVPKTEEEVQAFKTKYEGLMQASASGDAESLYSSRMKIRNFYWFFLALAALSLLLLPR